jgi:hypothetical protein
MVDYVNDAHLLGNRMMGWAFRSAPEHISEKLQAIVGSPADRMINGVEILYAHYDELDDVAKEITAQLFLYAVQMNWTAFNQGDRSQTIVDYISLDLGEVFGETPPPSEDWPEPEMHRREGVDWRAGPEEPAEPVPEQSTAPEVPDTPAE